MLQPRRIFLSLFFLLSLLLYSTQIGVAQSLQNVSVTAQVPLLPQHVLGVQKNSSLAHSHHNGYVKNGSEIEFTVSLQGLKNLPQKNRDVSIILNSENDKQSIKITQTTNSFGTAKFIVPISNQLLFDYYKASFVTTLANTQIDLFSEIYINIIRPKIFGNKILANNTYKNVYFPLEKRVIGSYSVTLIFATLKGIEKLYGFVEKTIAKPAAIFAAARDGPVVVCDACICSNQ